MVSKRVVSDWQTFRHCDGRRWEVRLDDKRVQLRGIAADGDTFERTRSFFSAAAAKQELTAMIAEQVADGFVDATVREALPAYETDWQALLEQLVGFWKIDDPSFDAESLRAEVLASPNAQEIVEHIMGLAGRWVIEVDGSRVRHPEHRDDHELWLADHAVASMPALLLALRHPDHETLLRIESLLDQAGNPAALPALISVVLHRCAGPRSSHSPRDAIKRLIPSAPEMLDRLVEALRHEDWRVYSEAAVILAEFATNDRYFLPLLAQAERGKKADTFAWAMMRAAEVRRDLALLPFLEWMLRSGRFHGGGYKARIREAIAGLRR